MADKVVINLTTGLEDAAQNARLAGASPLWDWIGGDDATVFSY